MTTPKPIHILIVEDDALYPELVQRMIKPIMDSFPGSRVTVVKTVPEALEMVASISAPDITILDLVLPPYGMQETLAHLDELEDKTAVVILTGSREEMVRAIIGDRDTPVIEKKLGLVDEPGPLMAAIYMAVDAYQNRRWSKQRADLEILKGAAHGSA